MSGDVLAHLSHDDHSFGDLESFGLAIALVWGIGGRGCGMILRGRSTFPDTIG